MNKLYNDTAVQAIANAIRAKNGSSDTYTIAEMSTALNDLSYYAKPTISNVTLATFEADGLPLNSLKVSVEAKQDLHGYDKPWVGGAGKNKANINITNPAVTVIKDNDGNVIGVRAATGVQSYVVTIKIGEVSIINGNTYTLSGSPQGYGNDTFRLDVRTHGTTNVYNNWNEYNNPTITATESVLLDIYIRVAVNYRLDNVLFQPQIEIGNQATSFAPYSNICPISGWSEVKVSDVDDVDNPTVTQTTTITLGQTVYGGEVDVVNGVLKITDGYIASYNGETLPSTWISSMDVYAEGTTPTTGAEVVYTLASSTTVSLTPTLIKSLEGTNNLSMDCGEVIELEYFKEV